MLLFLSLEITTVICLSLLWTIIIEVSLLFEAWMESVRVKTVFILLLSSFEVIYLLRSVIDNNTFLRAPQSKLLSWIWNSVSYVFGPSCTMHHACCTVTQTISVFVLFRLRRAVVTYERHTSQLRVSVGDIGRQVLRTCRSTELGPRCQCSGKRRHHGWEDVVQSEREVTVSTQSQVSSTVPTVSWCTGQLWTATCPQCHHCTTRYVDNIKHFSDIMCSTCWRIGSRALSFKRPLLSVDVDVCLSVCWFASAQL